MRLSASCRKEMVLLAQLVDASSELENGSKSVLFEELIYYQFSYNENCKQFNFTRLFTLIMFQLLIPLNV